MATVLLAALALSGCATKANLSSTSRIVLFCNPVGHAVDLALVGFALGVTVYSGGLVGPVDSGSPHQRGDWSVPGVMCVDAINDQVDAEEARSSRSTKGD
jgi:hypothetical protein